MKINVKEMVAFAMLGSVMFVSKWLMEWLPNMHLVGVFIVAITVVFRQKALYSIGVYVALVGLVGGFSLWWIPNLYVWVILWAGVMALPKTMPAKVAFPAYIGICAAHGFLFGILYAPAQALLFGLNGSGMLAWIAAGLPFDVIHGLSNGLLGLLIFPMIQGLTLCKRYL